MLNLIVNAIQSMSGVEDGNRELHISTVSIEPEGVCVAVRDTGSTPRLAPGRPQPPTMGFDNRARQIERPMPIMPSGLVV